MDKQQQAKQANELILIDPRVENFENYIPNLNPDIPVVFLKNTDSEHFFSKVFSDFNNLTALHIVSHDAKQDFFAKINTASSIINSHLASINEILLYGDASLNDASQQDLAHTLNTPITLVNSQAGAISLAGDWDLSETSGEESMLPYSVGKTISSKQVAVPSKIILPVTSTSTSSTTTNPSTSTTTGLTTSTYPSTSTTTGLTTSTTTSGLTTTTTVTEYPTTSTTTGLTTTSTTVSPTTTSAYYTTTTGASYTTVTTTTTVAIDDFTDNASSSGIITISNNTTTANGVINTSFDIDWFKVNLVANNRYSFEMKGVDSNDGSLYDPLLVLRNAAGKSLITDDDSGSGHNALIREFKAPATGIYYLEASSSGTFDIGTYKISTKLTSAAPVTNHAPQGSVLINTLQPKVGQVLTASNVLSDQDGIGIISYTWKTGEKVIGTGTTYKVTTNDLAKNIVVVASYTDKLGFTESVKSTLTAAVATANALPTGAVIINDLIPQQNTVLRVKNTLSDGDGLGKITYIWKAGTDILGTGDAYTLTQKNVGTAITVTASYTDGLGKFESVSSKTTALVENINDLPTGEVSITNLSPKVGQTLTATNTLSDADGLGSIQYSWFAGTQKLGQGSSYLIKSSDAGKAITVTASYVDGFGSVESKESAEVKVPAITKPGFIIEKNDLITSEDGDSAVISIRLGTAPRRDVTINFSSNDDTEGSISGNTSLVYTAKNWNIAQEIIITGNNDYLNDGNQPYIIASEISSSDVNYRQLKIEPLVITNIEDVTTTTEDAHIPLGTPRDLPLKIYGDTIIDTTAIDDNTQLYEISGSKPMNDILQGLDANDTLYGGNLQDDVSGGLGDDLLYGENDEDLLYGESGDDTLFGGQGKDTLQGGEGDDILNGGEGDLAIDVLIGGSGNDTYYLSYGKMDTIDDQGLLTDRDTAIIPYQINSYQLPTNIENAVISEGTQKSNLIGNNANNSLTGNQGNNSLAGNVGADTLFGGLGNDKLVGGSGDDALTGDIGGDTLTGGLGQDDFIFANKPSKDNIDTITDFATPDDVINLDNAAFQKLSQEGEFNSRNLVLNDVAVDKNDFIIYNKATGVLFYDADGNGTIAAVQIAILGVDLTLTSDNFIII